jgi:hypothetical protein
MNSAPKSPNIGSNNGMKSLGVANSIGKPINNSMKSIGAATNSAMNTISNATTSAMNSIGKAANSTINTVNKSLTGAVNSAANVAANFGNSIQNIGTPIKNSINAIPVSANTGAESMLPSFITIPMVLGFSIIVLLVTLAYYYQEQIATSLQDMSTSISNLFKPDPDAPVPTSASDLSDAAVPGEETETPPEPAQPHKSVIDSLIPKRKQVFNVSENKYTYADAEPLCKALGAELATYDQVKKSWDSGADWCNYGWIKGQAAVYPTQKSTFDRLQSSSSDDERLACGTVGINGGFMDNPELRFGVTCYGDKPSQSEHDVQNMMKGPNPPLTPEVLDMKKKELRYKQHSNEIGVMPFNEKQW